MSSGVCIHLVLHALVLTSCWLPWGAARTASVFSPSQLIAALSEHTFEKVLVATPLLALTEDVFQGVATPIRLNRTVSLVGSPDLPERPTVLLFARHKIELLPGFTFALVNVVMQFYVTDSPARAPNFYIFAPSLAPAVGSNTTRILLQDSITVLGVGLPLELRKPNLLPVKRPLNEGSGPQDVEFMVPDPHGTCLNDTAAPMLDRFWYPCRDLYKDVALPGGDVSTADGALVANNVSIRVLNSTVVCPLVASEECIASLGPYGCLVYTYRQLRGSPPVPISAQMAAILAQQQQQVASPGFNASARAPAGSQRSSEPGGGGSGTSNTAVLVGAIVGGVAGAALLLAALAAVLWSLRRKTSQQPQGQPAKCGGMDSSGSSDSAAQQAPHQQQQQQQQEYSKARVLVDVDGERSAETGAASSSLHRDPSGLHAHASDSSSRMLPDLVIRAAPFREGLATNLLVVTSQDTTATPGRGAPAPVPAAAAVPLSVSTESGGPGSGPRSFGAGPSTPAGQAKAAGAAAAAAAGSNHQPRPGSGAAASLASDGSGGGAAPAADDAHADKPQALTYAAKAAAILIQGSSDVDSLLRRICSSWGMAAPSAAGAGAAAHGSSGAAETEAAAGAAAEAAAGAAAGAVERSAATAAAAAARGAAGSIGTPAAAVSLLPPNASCEEAHAQVEVVELLPNKLGKGTFGRVLEGRYRGQRVAVKQALDLQDGLSVPVAKVVASFLQEVEVMGRCEHPNICKLLAACLAPPKLCLVMEMCDTSLEALIYGGPPGQLLPLPTLLHIAIQVAQGLEYLHPTVLHRDLKPANVLISNPDSDRPIVKLTDFGLSRISEMTVRTANPEAGTPAYMAPETFDINNYKLTHKVDIYAFGVLLWAMLTGEEPWKGYPLVSVAYSVHCGRRPPLAELSEDRCPRKLRRLIEQCWDAQARRRPAAAEAVKELLLLREQLVNDDAAPSSSELLL